MVNVDQQHDLQTQIQNKAGCVLTALEFRWDCVMIINVEKIISARYLKLVLSELKVFVSVSRESV
jgi:hypothetical protein